jgi:Cupredoxin-like domain
VHLRCAEGGRHLRAAWDEVAHRRARQQRHTFTTDCLAAPNEQPFTIEFDNQETSTQATHNIHICDSPKDFIGETVIHGRSITCSVPAIPAGTHLFRCDQHPTLMHGVFIVR